MRIESLLKNKRENNIKRILDDIFNKKESISVYFIIIY